VLDAETIRADERDVAAVPVWPGATAEGTEVDPPPLQAASIAASEPATAERKKKSLFVDNGISSI
jgi:hypothetical protein